MAFVVIPAETGEGTWHGLSPLAFPLVLMGGIALASLGLLAQGLFQRRHYEDVEAPLTGTQLRNVIIVFAVIVAGALALQHFGYWVGAPAVIAGCMLYMGERHPARILATALAPVAVVYGLVHYVLGTPLP